MKELGVDVTKHITEEIQKQIDEISLSQVIQAIAQFKARVDGIEMHLSDDDSEDEKEGCGKSKCCNCGDDIEDDEVHQMMHLLLPALQTKRQWVGATAMMMLIMQYFKAGKASEESFIEIMKKIYTAYGEDE